MTHVAVRDNPPTWTVPIVLFVAALSLRIGFVAVSGRLGQDLPDRGYREYAVAAQRLLEHGALVSPLIRDDVDRTPSSLLPPAYVGIVAAIYGIFGVDSFAATLFLQLLNAVATSLAVVGTFAVGRSLAGRRAGLFAALLTCINPTLIGFTDWIWDTSLFTLCVVVTLCMSLGLGRATHRGSVWVGFGFWLGLVALLNPALTVTYPFLVLWPILRPGTPRARSVLHHVGLVLAGWALAIAPWTVRNYRSVGEFTYIRGGFPLELWLGVCPEADAQGAEVYKKQFPLNNDEVQSRIAAIGERAFVRECGDRAYAAIAADPWRFARLIGTRMVDFWLGSAFSHAPPGGGGIPPSRGRQAVMVFFSVEVVAILGLLAYRRRTGRDVPWLIAVIAVFSLVYCVTHMQVRFRAPLEPLLAVILGILAGGGVRTRFSPPPAYNPPA